MAEESASNISIDDSLLARLENCTNLPSPPTVAIRIIELSNDLNVDIGKVADVISMDPALSAKILRIANSPIYALRRKTENLHQARDSITTTSGGVRWHRRPAPVASASPSTCARGRSCSWPACCRISACS